MSPQPDLQDQPQPAQPDPPQYIPPEVLKDKRSINLYFIAVGALGLVVLLVPLLSLRGTPLPAELWTGWNVALGGLIALIGAQGQGGGTQ